MSRSGPSSEGVGRTPGGQDARAPVPGPDAKRLSRPPKNPGLRDLLDRKRRWSYEPDAAARALGFQGWHGRGYLPHFDAPNVTQFVTFRLGDAMPASRRSEWEAFLQLEDDRQRRIPIEAYLDRGVGECWLRQPEIAKLVEDALLFFHGEVVLVADGSSEHPAGRMPALRSGARPSRPPGAEAPTTHASFNARYRLRGWIIMPNHVHVLLDIASVPLARIVEGWKSFTANEANKFLGRTGRFWEPEYWDELMRDEAQTTRAVRYIEENPLKAKLVREPKDWPWSSARFRGKYAEPLLPDKKERVVCGVG